MATRPFMHWRINVVPNADPNAAGTWIDVGYAQFRHYAHFTRTARQFDDKVPEGYHIVGVESKP